MTAQELRDRTKRFAIEIILFTRRLPRSEEARVIGRQLLRSGTGIGSNYRAACRRRSDADFVAKLGVVIEEADETGYWLELLADSRTVALRAISPLLEEADQLTRIFVTSRETTRRRMRAERQRSRRPSITNH